MQFAILVTAALGMAMPALGHPYKDSAIEARATVDALLTCDVNVGILPATNAIGASLYTSICIHIFHCAHSAAPSIVDNEYIGTCLNCPIGNAEDGFGDCVYVAQP
jgi:hypothetical protein